MPLQEGSRPGWFTETLWPCEDRRRLRSLARSGLGPQGRLPGDGAASFLYGEGFLSNQQTFRVVQRRLSETPISWVEGLDFTEATPLEVMKGDLKGKSAKSTVLFAMDMWSSHFAKPLSKQLTLQWRAGGRLATRMGSEIKVAARS